MKVSYAHRTLVDFFFFLVSSYPLEYLAVSNKSLTYARSLPVVKNDFKSSFPLQSEALGR